MHNTTILADYFSLCIVNATSLIRITYVIDDLVYTILDIGLEHFNGQRLC